MTISSMTGFARSSGQEASCIWAWELRSVNAKSFDCRVRLPSSWEALDGPARKAIAAELPRGTIHAALEISDQAGAQSVRINTALLDHLAKEATDSAKRLKLAPPSIDTLLQMRGVVELAESNAEPEARISAEQAVLAGLQQAIAALVHSRRVEGLALKAVLLGHLEALEAGLSAAHATPGRQADAVRQRIAAQVRDLMGSTDALDPQRLHQEALLIAIRADIQEELDRLAAHLKDARIILDQGGPVGRKLDFLSQELSREVNTLCAKSNDVALTGIGLAMKGRVEQFREQVQNVE